MSGSSIDRNDLVASNLHLARAVARRTAAQSGTLAGVVDADDLTQELVLVLIELAEAFDPYLHPNVPFAAYANARLAKRVYSCQRSYRLVGPVRAREGQRWVQLNGDDNAEIMAQRPAPPIHMERGYRRMVLDRITDRRARLFCALRWFRNMSLEAVAPRMGLSCQSSAFRMQQRYLPLMLAAMDRRDLMGRPCCRSNRKERA